MYGGVFVTQGAGLFSVGHIHKTGTDWSVNEDGSLTVWVEDSPLAMTVKHEVAVYKASQWSNVRLIDVEVADNVNEEPAVAGGATFDGMAFVPKQSEEEQAIDTAWGIIANAWDGDWESAPKHWIQAARHWRDRYVSNKG